MAGSQESVLEKQRLGPSHMAGNHVLEKQRLDIWLAAKKVHNY